MLAYVKIYPKILLNKTDSMACYSDKEIINCVNLV